MSPLRHPAVACLDGLEELRDGVLRVAAVHRDVPFTKAMTSAVDGEIRDLAAWLDLELETKPACVGDVRRMPEDQDGT